MAPYQYWLDNGVKIFSLQFNFLRPSIYDLKTDENDPSFLSNAQKSIHHLTYSRFLQDTKPQNYIFANYKYTSRFTMTNLYTIDHSRITGYLRNYDPNKQYFCLLPHNDTSRPLIVPQEYFIHFDDYLLPCNIPTEIVKPLTVIKHLVSSPLDDKDNSYYTALAKQPHPSNEFLFPLWFKLNKNVLIQITKPQHTLLSNIYKPLAKNVLPCWTIVLSRI